MATTASEKPSVESAPSRTDVPTTRRVAAPAQAAENYAFARRLSERKNMAHVARWPAAPHAVRPSGPPPRRHLDGGAQSRDRGDARDARSRQRRAGQGTTACARW